METYFVESHQLAVLLLGAVMCLVGAMWLIVAAYRTHFLWGLGMTVLFPIIAPLFAIARPERGGRPLGLLLLGAEVAAAPVIVNRIKQRFITLGEYEKIVDGERHLTLTGWDKKDYSILVNKPDTIVLQMANADVTDETMEFTKKLTKLRELDISNSKVTDASLPLIKALPLKSLRIRGTGITDEGFREQLMPLESLMEVDAQDTAIKTSTLREWKNAKPDRINMK